ncbi:MAG: amidohydrolase [Deltaproteobacteria bacterium]|nr:amidohydrolase [Deltaproteobacteria bacterium]
MNNVDLIVKNGTIVTMDEDFTIIEQGVVAVSGDTIFEVGKSGDVSMPETARIIDARGGIIMPGLVNTHTHAAMTCFRGLADDLPLMDWLEKHIFPAESRLNYNTVLAGARLGCAEMLLSGTTCFCDMYLFEDAVGEAARAAGMRAVVGEVLYDFDSPNYGSIEKGFEYTRYLIEKWQDDPLVSVAVEPHSPYLCDPELLCRAAAISGEYGIPLVIHVSETIDELETIKKRYGKTPVGHLADIGVLSSRTVACHCVAVSDDDIRLLSENHVNVSHNPESNMKLAAGVAPVPQMLSAGITVGLGTDGPASNNDLDMFAEMDTAAKLHKVNTLDPTVVDARTVLRMATIDGARALGLGNVCGSLEPGKKADIIVIDTRKPHLTPMYDPCSHLVYAVRANDVSSVIIGGNIVVENRRINTFDVDEIMAEIKEIGKGIALKNGR